MYCVVIFLLERVIVQDMGADFRRQYIIGFYMDNGESGYYVYNANSNRTEKVPNKQFINDENAKTYIRNARMVNSNSETKPIFTGKDFGEGIVSIFNPAIINRGRVTKDNETIVYIDFNRMMYGKVQYGKNHIIWGKLGDLENIPMESKGTVSKDSYNNLVYNKSTGLLHLEAYEIIGADNARDIILKSVRDNKEKAVSNKKGTSKKEKKECKCREKDTFYRDILNMMGEEDIMTLPKEAMQILKFRLTYNLETNMDLSERVSLGIVKLGVRDNTNNVPVIVRFSENKDTIRIQKMGTLDIDTIRAEYASWRANKRYLSL